MTNDSSTIIRAIKRIIITSLIFFAGFFSATLLAIKPFCGSGSATSKSGLTDIRLKLLAGELAVYHMKNGNFPDKLSLVEVRPQLLLDLWDNEISYRKLDGDRAVELKSLGADGKDGGEAENSDIIVVVNDKLETVKLKPKQ